MTPRVPILPTTIVAAAMATMIALGVWQLQRMREKQALLAVYAQAANLPPIAWQSIPLDGPPPLFRAATGNCLGVTGFRTAAGQNLRGDSGYLVIADCRTAAGPAGMAVELGWSRNPNAGRDYHGGLVSGMIAPDRRNGMRLVAATAGPGLERSAPPSPDTIPNNHFSYAIQWFLFAGIALLIYVLALRWRRRDERAKIDG